MYGGFMDYKLGSIVVMKKEHPCGTNLWEIIRTGVDIKIKCVECGRCIMMDRLEFEKKLIPMISPKYNRDFVFQLWDISRGKFKVGAGKTKKFYNLYWYLCIHNRLCIIKSACSIFR